MCCGLLNYFREKEECKGPMVLKKGTLALYKMSFIMQCQKLIKIETFISAFTYFYTLPYFVPNTFALESEGCGLSFSKLGVK